VPKKTGGARTELKSESTSLILMSIGDYCKEGKKTTGSANAEKRDPGKEFRGGLLSWFK